MRRLRGLKSLVHEAVDLTTELVRDGHEASARSVLRVLGAVGPLPDTVRKADELRRQGTDLVLGAIRSVNGAVRDWSDAALDHVERSGSPEGLDEPARDQQPLPLRSDLLGSWAWLADGAVGLLNGALGDHLHLQGNGLDLGLQLRYHGHYLPADPTSCRESLAGVGPKVAVFVHGLGTTEWSWCFEGAAYHGDPEASFATLLERDLDYTPLLVRYNTGRHVSESGRDLAQELERIFEMWPVPLSEIVLIGHSMGGLVVRSACHYADASRRSPESAEPSSTRAQGWVDAVTHVFCLGSPHLGAPLEKLGALATAILGAIDAPGTQIPARLARARSAGIKDMRHGCLVDEDWLGRDPDVLSAPLLAKVPLLRHARYTFVSATVTKDAAHPLGRLLGDLVVLVPSAAGPRVEEHTFPIDTRHYGGVVHHQLQNHPSLYAQLRETLRGPRAAADPKGTAHLADSDSAIKS